LLAFSDAALLAFSVASRTAAARVLITDCAPLFGLFFGRLRDLLTVVQPPSSSFASVGSGPIRMGVIDGEECLLRFLGCAGVECSLSGVCAASDSVFSLDSGVVGISSGVSVVAVDGLDGDVVAADGCVGLVLGDALGRDCGE